MFFKTCWFSLWLLSLNFVLYIHTYICLIFIFDIEYHMWLISEGQNLFCINLFHVSWYYTLTCAYKNMLNWCLCVAVICNSVWKEEYNVHVCQIPLVVNFYENNKWFLYLKAKFGDVLQILFSLLTEYIDSILCVFYVY